MVAGAELGMEQETEMWNSSKTTPANTKKGQFEENRHMFWVDGVGAYLVCLSERVSIGGPTSRDSSDSADVALLANLSHRHASIVRNQDGYLLKAHSQVRVGERLVEDRTFLNDGYDITLGESVKLRFRLPSVLSTTATLEFLSDHRPSQSVDGIILMEETCLFGPGPENHIQCPDWSDPVLIYRRQGQFCCKSQSEIIVGGKLAPSGSPLPPGEVATGPNFRFRVEPLIEPAGASRRS